MTLRTATNSLWLYERLSRFAHLSYRNKILLMAFVGTHIPLLTLAAFFALQSSADWRDLITTGVVALAATLVGTAITLWVLNHLLRPVLLTSKALRDYRECRQQNGLPLEFRDEVGTLMADAGRTMEHLDALLDTLEHVDEATGLPNRKRFTQLLTQRLSNEQSVSVLVVRIVNLAQVSDAVDQRHADDVCRAIAARLAGHAHVCQQLARIDSNHFACLIGTVASEATPWIDVLERVRTVLAECGGEVEIESVGFAPLLRAGVAVFPEDGNLADALLDRAISAASQAVAATPVVMHSAPARAAALQRFRLEQDLRRALERDQFELFYQPVIDVAVERIVGTEALIRWRHPDRGMVAPGEFIAAAEHSGLIEPIGRWVIQRACAQAREWTDLGFGRLRMSINVSARQFHDPGLTRFVLEVVNANGISPDQIELELTETAAMADHEHTRRVFTSLRDMGVGIAIDDFGTGFASLSYLRRMPFDKLKIDREFVMNVHQVPQHQAICGALIELAKGLELKVLAEGTESEDEVRYLVSRGCHQFQGYYFSRPLPSVEISPLLESPVRSVRSEGGPRRRTSSDNVMDEELSRN